MDNVTLVESLKFLNYHQLCKKSLESRKYRDLIQRHYRFLPRLYVHRLVMVHYLTSPKMIKLFDKEISSHEYDEWVIRNNYSEESSSFGNSELSKYILEPSAKRESIFYHLLAESGSGSGSKRIDVMSAHVQMNKETRPLFEHFTRLLTSPQIYIHSLELCSETNFLKLLSSSIVSNPYYGRIQCIFLDFYIESMDTNIISFIKDHLLCGYVSIYDQIRSNSHDGEVLNFLLTGGICTSSTALISYDISNIIHQFIKKFLDLKENNGCIIASIKSESTYYHDKPVSKMLRRNYSKFLVHEERNEESHYQSYLYELKNMDINKKLELLVRVSHPYSDWDYECTPSFSMCIKHL